MLNCCYNNTLELSLKCEPYLDIKKQDGKTEAYTFPTS